MTLGVSTGILPPSFLPAFLSFKARSLYILDDLTDCLSDLCFEEPFLFPYGLKGFEIWLGSILRNLENLSGERLLSVSVELFLL